MDTEVDSKYNKCLEALETGMFPLSDWHIHWIRMKEKRTEHTNIHMINNFIHRSGLTDEEVDRLPFIHVTGTKGKGSTCAYTENILRRHGYRTGLFTSPHLVEVRERICIDGQPISKSKYCHYFWKVYNKLKETEDLNTPIEEGQRMPIPFAFHVVMSLHVFLGEGVDVVVMEVGIGGLNDSTNFIRHPVACAITSLGLDHMEKLGDTIESIAFQKSGIFKKQCPALTATQCDSATQVLLNRAHERDCPLYLVKPLSKEIMEVYNFTLGIAGDKQRDNAAIAVQLFHMWEHYRLNKCQVLKSPIQGVADIPTLLCQHLDEATIQGLSKCHWPGRAHVISRPGVTYYLDGAHTKESMEVCASWFQERANEEREKTKGKVVRVLLYYTGIQRNPEYLMYPLTHCGFDAAVFCPYVVSSVASQCRLDLQQNKIHPDVQREIVERNKTIWDKLTFTGENNNLKYDCSVENFVQGIRKELDRIEGIHSSDKTINSQNGIDKTMSLQNSSYSQRNDKPTNETLFTNQCMLQDACIKQDNQIEANELSPTLYSKHSLIFPSIIEALHWAGQGRDSVVQVLDPRSISQQIPPNMEDAVLVQILATGSLTIIGGILDVLSSFSGNIYSL